MGTPEPAASSGRADSGYTHVEGGTLDPRTLNEIVQLLHREGGRALAQSRALAMWTHEIVLCRNTLGRLTGAHGFCYADIAEGDLRCRLIYNVFSITNERFADAAMQVGQVGLRLHARFQDKQMPVVWATPPNRGRDYVAPGGPATARRFVLPMSSSLPQTFRFYTDIAAKPGESDTLPPVIESALIELLAEQREAEKDAQAGRTVMVPLWRRFGAGLAAATSLAGAAALVLFLHGPSGEMTRAKGTPVLHVYRQTDAGGEEVESGSAFKPGDRIQFAVDLAAPGRVAVIGVESTGRLYTAWPQASVDRPGLDQLQVGVGQRLDGALQLDQSTGVETLYLVACTPKVKPACASRGPSTEPMCVAGCTTTPFVLDKKAP